MSTRSMLNSGASEGVLIAFMGTGLLAAVLAGCAAAPPTPLATAATAESVQEQENVGAPECVDDKEQPVTCASDGDCCAGFVCGKDPELSQRSSYCIFGG